MKIEFDFSYDSEAFNKEEAQAHAYSELAKELRRLGVNYNVHGIGIPDAFDDGEWCLHSEGGYWLAYKSERGRRSHLCIFTSPYDAANFLLWQVASTHSGENKSIGKLPRAS